jgi:hypothetical protein
MILKRRVFAALSALVLVLNLSLAIPTPAFAAPNVATVTSVIYSVSAGGTASEAITNVPFNTANTTFLAGLTKGDPNQTWDSAGIANPVVSGNTLVVTSQDTSTTVTYTVGVNPPASSIATVTSSAYTVSTVGGGSETITGVVFGTSKATFLAALTKGEPNQSWNSAGIADPVASGNTLVVTAQDTTTIVTYSVTVGAPSAVASLSGLVISQGILTPVFASGTDNYTVGVVNSVSSMTVTPTVSESHAVVTVNGAVVASGSASPSIALSVGSNVITIVVTAQDTITIRTYRVTVTRAASSIATVTSSAYTVSTVGGGSETITGVVFGTSKLEQCWHSRPGGIGEHAGGDGSGHNDDSHLLGDCWPGVQQRQPEWARD